MLGLGLGLGWSRASVTFNPSTLSLTGWWRGSYSSSPWVGTASAGSSGSNNLTEATNPPSAGTTVDTFAPAQFDGTNDKLGHAGTVEPTFVSTTAWSSWVMFKAGAAAADGGAGSRYLSPHFWASSDSGVGVGFNSAGIFVQQADTSPAQRDTVIACATGAWHALFAWWDGSLLHLQLDSGSPVTTSCTSMYSGVSSAALVVGANYNSATFFTGGIMDMGIMSVAFSGSDITDIYSYLKARYPSAGLP